jgi:hypothetical protein
MNFRFASELPEVRWPGDLTQPLTPHVMLLLPLSEPSAVKGLVTSIVVTPYQPRLAFALTRAKCQQYL